ncbi:uncharacterized protein [Rutidosis leptorrhynchoides]|uniref:uncharacterized protein n=1 Tax=Rutidosis leptorrhynchoides TaxID=125765 RepID=UPI003A99354D
MSFICGTFNNQEEDDFEATCLYSPTPSRKTRSHKFYSRRNKNNNNPYSSRGLDKFEALLADIDDKKRKIFTQKGSQYISFVRFVYSNSDNIKPVIVWLKDPKRNEKDHHHRQNNLKDTKISSIPTLQDSTLDHMTEPKDAQHAKPLMNTRIIRVDQWKSNLKRKLEEWWMPSYNLPLFVILVLVFLTFFGRSLAIICTSIAWYLIPTVDGTIEIKTTKQKKMIKNNHSRKQSENMMISSPKAFLSGPLNVQQNHKMKKLMTF